MNLKITLIAATSLSLASCRPAGENDVVVAMERRGNSMVIGLMDHYDQHVGLGLYSQLSIGDTICYQLRSEFAIGTADVTKGPCECTGSKL